MDRVELICIAVGAAVVIAVAIAVFIVPSVGGDYRKGGISGGDDGGG